MSWIMRSLGTKLAQSDTKKASVGVRPIRDAGIKTDSLRHISEKELNFVKQFEENQGSQTIMTSILEASNSSNLPEQEARVHGDTESEMGFMVECFRVIMDILENNCDTNILPKPNECLKAKVSDGYSYASKLASLCKGLKSEIEKTSRKLEELCHVDSEAETTDHLKNTKSRFEISALKTSDSSAKEPGQGKFSLDGKIDEVEKLIKKQLREIYNLRNKVIKEESDLQKAKRAHEKTLQDVNSLRTRLSEFVSAKLTNKNPKIDDLSDPNRPTKLQEQYSQLYDEERMEAFINLCDASPDKSERCERDITNILLEMFTESFEFCRDTRQTQIKDLRRIIFHIDSDMASNHMQEEDIQMNEVIEKHMTQAIKLGSDKTGENVAEAFFRKEDMQKKFGNQIDMNETYVKKCVKLCWLMQVQTPPVCIDLSAKPGDQFDKDTYREFIKTGKEIDFIVWPPLRIYEGGPLLAKGIAQGK